MSATKDSWKREAFTAGLPIPYQKTFALDEFATIRRGLIPEVMEDKWFIYFEEPHLYFHHSWSGQPVYRVTLVENGDGVSVAGGRNTQKETGLVCMAGHTRRWTHA